MKLEVEQIAVTAIVAGDNDRAEFNPTKLRELADSIALDGLAQPITIRPCGTGRYEIVAGERRYRAVRLLEWPTIPALVRLLTDEQAARIMLAENEQRVDLNPLEQGRAYDKWARKFGWTPAQIATFAKRPVDYVRGRLSLLRLCDEAQDLLTKGQLPVTYALIMVNAEPCLDGNRQRVALKYLASTAWHSADSFRSLVEGLLSAQQQDSLFSLDSFLVAHNPVSYGAPVAESRYYPVAVDLPPLRKQKNTALCLEQYIADLLALGKVEEAAVVGTVYDGLLRASLAWLPAISPLAKKEEEAS